MSFYFPGSGRTNKQDVALLGVKEAEENIRVIMDSLTSNETRTALIPAARIFKDRARELAPYDPGREKGTHIRDAFFVDTRDHSIGGLGSGTKTVDILVGVSWKKAPHSGLMEYGHSKLPEGKPFLRPAKTQTQDAVRKQVFIAIKAAVETNKMKSFRSMWE